MSNLDLDNLAESQFLKALDALYERGANDQHDARKFDARGCREYQAVLDMVRAPQWLPIESAPRYGVPVLLDHRDWHTRVLRGGWDAHEQAWRAHGFGCPAAQPTHWMALPAAPEVE